MPEAFTTVNPASGEVLTTYPLHTAAEIDRKLDLAGEAFDRFRTTSFGERRDHMHRLATRLDERIGDLSSLMTAEMGKPIVQARAEVEKCAWVCRYYADHAEEQLADEVVETEARRSLVTFQPIGAVLAIMPWNFPLWQVLRFAAPNIMAGNVAVLKHAANVLGCGFAIEELFEEAGFADGVFQHIVVDHDQLADVIADERIRGVTLTGSDRAGRAVAGNAGEHLKKTVLELGGTDAFIVLADADLELAVDKAVTARVQNNGQSCIAAKRFILEAAIADEFTTRFVDRMAALRMGDPADPETEIGPLARQDLRDELHDQVRRSVKEGAEILTGGAIPDGEGYFYPPTVLRGAAPGSVPYREELFGPVAAITVVADEARAVAAANATRFGLGGAVFTRDLRRGEDVARRLECGCAFVNELVKSHPNLPFGGVKQSGYGRELGLQGIREFVNVKTIWVD
jgi:acyl-CoA reductase-like NAD-dependent aldehyde dehydrogenase